MKLETLITEFAAAAGMENPVAVEGVWKFSADGHVFGVVEDGSGRDAWIFDETQDAAEADAPQGPSEAPSRIPPERPAGEDDGAMPIFPGMLRV